MAIGYSLGHDGPSKGEGHFGYDEFALTDPHNHVVEKYVLNESVKKKFTNIMKYENNAYVHYLNSTKKSYHRVWERRSPTWDKTVSRRLFSHIFPWLIIAVYFVAYSVE